MSVTEAFLQPQLLPACGEHQPGPEAFARPRQHLPRPAAVPEEEQLHPAAGRLSGLHAGGKHLRLVEDERIAGRRKFGRPRNVWWEIVLR